MKYLHLKYNYKALRFPKTIFILSLLFLLMGVGKIKAQQDSLAVIQGPSNNNSWLQFSDAPNALYHHLAGQAYDLLNKRTQAIAKLHSLSDWQKRQEYVGQTLRDIVGPFPEKSPLHAQITKTVDKKGYRIEDIIYQSQPGYYVTSSLFIPDGIDNSAPTILFCIGHSMRSYRRPLYQHTLLNLVKKGFIVLAVDPVGQGERLQYYDSKSGQSIVGGSTNQHSYAGGQAFVTGSSQARYMIWDDIRGIDYLVSRPEVDPNRIGVTGISGGGTQTAYVAALDKRVAAAAPENYITSFRRLLESIGPQDAEQNLPGEIAMGLDHADLLEVRAPKPTLMLTTTRDFFSIQGARETAREVARIYNAYGTPDRFGMVTDDNIHTYTKKNREAMYAFFQKYLDNPGSSKDEDMELLENHELQVTRTGQVATTLEEAETVFSLNRKQAKSEVQALQAARKDLGRHLPNAVRAAKELSGYWEPDTVDQPVFAGRFPKDGYAIEKYFVEGEGDYPIPYLLLVPDDPNGKGLIYLNPAGKSANFQQMTKLASQGITVLAPDLLGVGEMGGSDYRGDSYLKGTSYNVWFASVLIGRSIVGIQAGDVVRLTRLLQKRKDISEVYGLARRQMGPVLLHAAAFDSSLAGVALIKPYSSYRSIAVNRFYDPKYIPSTVAGALTAYDFPDLAASLAPRKLLITGLTDGSGKPADRDTITKDTAVIKAAYQQEHAGTQLKVRAVKNIQGSIENWLK